MADAQHPLASIETHRANDVRWLEIRSEVDELRAIADYWRKLLSSGGDSVALYDEVSLLYAQFEKASRNPKNFADPMDLIRGVHQALLRHQIFTNLLDRLAAMDERVARLLHAERRTAGYVERESMEWITRTMDSIGQLLAEILTDHQVTPLVIESVLARLATEVDALLESSPKDAK